MHSRTGTRRGRAIGFPRFEKKTISTASFRLRDKHSRTGRSAIRVGDDDTPRSVTWPGLGLGCRHSWSPPLARDVKSLGSITHRNPWLGGWRGSDGRRKPCRGRTKAPTTGEKPLPGRLAIIIVWRMCVVISCIRSPMSWSKPTTGSLSRTTGKTHHDPRTSERGPGYQCPPTGRRWPAPDGCRCDRPGRRENRGSCPGRGMSRGRPRRAVPDNPSSCQTRCVTVGSPRPVPPIAAGPRPVARRDRSGPAAAAADPSTDPA